MPSVKTLAIVLRRADYSEYDRMVTLFSPEMGRLDAIARGCRRPKSQLIGSTELFTSGEYVLYHSHDRYSVEQCQIRENFYGLREDYEKLLHGVYWLKLLEHAVMPGEAYEALFLTTLQALAHLDVSELPQPLITMGFEMHFMRALGLSPRVDRCALCGQALTGKVRFDPAAGGAVCEKCMSDAPFISHEALRVVLKLPRTRFEQISLLENYTAWPEAAWHFRQFMNYRLPETARFAPPLQKYAPIQ